MIALSCAPGNGTCTVLVLSGLRVPQLLKPAGGQAVLDVSSAREGT